MPRTLLLVPTGPAVGLTGTCLGLLRALDRRGVRIGFFKPAAQPRADGAPDESTALVRLTAALDPPEPLSAADVERQLGAGGVETVLEEVVAAWDRVAASADVVVVEGLRPGPTHAYSTELNQAVAKALDANVLPVGSWRDRASTVDSAANTAAAVTAQADHVAEMLAITARGYQVGEAERVIGCIVNHLPADVPNAEAEVRERLARHCLRLVGAAAERSELRWPRVLDVVRELGMRVLNEGDLERRIKGVAIFAQAVPGGLRVLDEGRLVLVPGDRHEVVMAACLAVLNGTRLAALLLTAGIEPDPKVWELTHAATAMGLPILVSPEMTYETASRVNALDSRLRPDDLARAEAATTWSADALDDQLLETLTAPVQERRLSPAAFRHRLVEVARAADGRILLPEGAEPRTVRAAVEASQRGIARCVLLAPPDEVAHTVRTLGLTLPGGIDIVDPASRVEDFVDGLVELRRNKGMTDEMAREQLGDAITVGMMMLQQGEVDGLVAGAAHTTADTVRPALQIIGARPDARLVSSIFFMCLPDEVVVYGDCAINPQPDAEQLADIALQSAASAKAFGIEPRVAMISFSTGTSGSGSDVEKVAEATRIARARDPELAIDGPLQYDAAATASVGRSKRPGSTVAGRATVFIFPDLDTGNTTYKAVQRSAHVVSVGPMLQGLAKPVNDLSRGATVEDIVYTIALTAIQARTSPMAPNAAAPR